MGSVKWWKTNPAFVFVLARWFRVDRLDDLKIWWLVITFHKSQCLSFSKLRRDAQFQNNSVPPNIYYQKKSCCLKKLPNKIKYWLLSFYSPEKNFVSIFRQIVYCQSIYQHLKKKKERKDNTITIDTYYIYHSSPKKCHWQHQTVI